MSVQVIDADMIVDTVPKLSLRELRRIRSVIDRFIISGIDETKIDNEIEDIIAYLQAEPGQMSEPSDGMMDALEAIWAHIPEDAPQLTSEDLEQMRYDHLAEKHL